MNSLVHLPLHMDIEYFSSLWLAHQLKFALPEPSVILRAPRAPASVPLQISPSSSHLQTVWRGELPPRVSPSCPNVIDDVGIMLGPAIYKHQDSA